MSQAKTAVSAPLRASLAVICAVGLTAAAWAAEAPAPAKPPAVAPAAPAADAGSAPKSIWEEAPYQMYAQGGRIDPFTRGKPKVIVVPEGPGANTKLAEAIRTYDQAETLLSSEKENRYDECRRLCDKGIQDLHQTMVEIGKKDELAREMERARELLERFQRLAATANRLKLRQKTEADFAKQKITVDGIVWNEQSPSAAISGKVCSEGTLLSTAAGGQDLVQVHRIRRDAVIFLFRGVQIAVRLDRGGR